MKYLCPINKDFFNLVLLALFFISSSAWSQNAANDTKVDDGFNQRAKVLSDEASSIARDFSDLAESHKQLVTRLAEFASRSIEQTEVARARLDVETQNTKIKSINLDIANTRQQHEAITASIKSLKNKLQTQTSSPQNESVKTNITQTELILAEQEKLLELEIKRIWVLNERKQLETERLKLKEQLLFELQKIYQSQQELIRVQNFEELEKQLGEERITWQQKSKEFSTQLEQYRSDPSSSASRLEYYEALFLEAEDSIFFIDIRLKAAKIQGKLEVSQLSKIETDLSFSQLKEMLDELNRLEVQASSLRDLLTTKNNLLQQRIEVVSKRQSMDATGTKDYQKTESIYKRLIDNNNKQLVQVTILHDNVSQRTKTIEAVYQQQKRSGLTERHRLPYTLDEWRLLVKEISVLPEKTLQVAEDAILGLWTTLQQADMGTILRLIFLWLVWSILCLSLVRLPRFKELGAHEDFSKKVLLISNDLLCSIRFSLLLGGLIVISGWLLDIFLLAVVIGSIFAIWIVARLAIGISGWILVSPIGLSEKQPRLHQLIVYFIFIMSLSSFILVLGFVGLITPSLMDLFERLVMVLLLPLAYLALRIRRLLIDKICEQKDSGYWVRLIGLISLAIPAAIFIAAIFGIAGYINLAWLVAWHLGIFIAVVSTWLVSRGLVLDLAQTVRNAILQKSERGMFWVKSVVEPLQLLARLGLFLLAAWILYRFFGGDPATGLNFKGWLKHPLFTLGETPVSGFVLLGAMLLLSLVFYFGRWAREITYGWLYSNIHDLGVRNSLSIFTQYAVVVVGLLIAFNILGINLTSLTVFAGALGVGIGFGLQNIANNFISGLILLAERPIRTTDWVTIGDKEGEVAEIGMRSVTVTTWDNQDVIIPNSDLTTNAFVNWTRTNNVVRTVLTIGIRYQDDPHKAQAVIYEAVTMQPEVSLEPAPRVFLTEFGSSSVDFRVQYHMNVMEFNRLEVKSKVMFAIWDALKEADIGIPFPQQDIYIKELPQEGAQSFPKAE